MQIARFGSAGAAVGGKLYIVGGSSGQQPLDMAECFDPTLGRWEIVPPMLTARQRCAAAGLDGRLYVLGGENNRPLAVVERFDPGLRCWEAFPSMLMERT